MISNKISSLKKLKKTKALTLRSNFLYSITNHQGLLFQLFFLLLCTICVPGEQFHRLQGLILLALGNSVSYSNSICPLILFCINGIKSRFLLSDLALLSSLFLFIRFFASILQAYFLNFLIFHSQWKSHIICTSYIFCKIQ